MLSRSTQHKLALAFSSMILLHALVFWQEWPWIPIGFPDFTIFYTAGKILKQGKGAQLYDDRLQETVQSSFAPAAVAKRGSILPFNHPPFEALFFLPFTAFSFLTAYFVWLALNGGILTGAVLVLRKNLAVFAAVSPWLSVMIGFGFFPAYVALVQGQDSIWVLFCYVMTFGALRRNADFAAGLWLGLGLCKFHLVLPFVLVLLVLRKFRAIAGFAAVAACLGLVGLAAVGWQGAMRYPGYVLWTDRAAKYRWNFVHGNNPNLRALVLSLSPQGDSHLAQVVVIAASISLLGIAAWYWKRSSELQGVSHISVPPKPNPHTNSSREAASGQNRHGGPRIGPHTNSSREAASSESPARQCREQADECGESRQGRHIPHDLSHDALQLGMALAITATLLVSYHTWVQDMAIILLPIFLVLDVLLRRKTPSGWPGGLLWASIAILLCSPLYAVLLLRFSQFRFMALVLLVFFATTVMALKNPVIAKPATSEDR